MIATRSKRVNLPIIGKARTESFSQLKLPTNGEVLQRFIHYLKVLRLIKNKATNVTYDEVVEVSADCQKIVVLSTGSFRAVLFFFNDLCRNKG